MIRDDNEILRGMAYLLPVSIVFFWGPLLTAIFWPVHGGSLVLGIAARIELTLFFMGLAALGAWAISSLYRWVRGAVKRSR